MQFHYIKMRYSIEPKDRVYMKGYGFMSFARSMSNKYWKKLVDTAQKSATDAIKTASKRAIQKTAEAIGDLVGNKIADKITSVSKKLPTIDGDVEWTTHKKRYISPEERRQIIDELSLKINKLNILCNINIIKYGISKNIELVRKHIR